MDQSLLFLHSFLQRHQFVIFGFQLRNLIIQVIQFGLESVLHLTQQLTNWSQILKILKKIE